MSELYSAQFLLQSKNPILFNKSERQRFGNLLSDTNHFKLALSLESKKNMSKMYKNVVLKIFTKRSFIYHMDEPDSHLYLIIKGKVAYFAPNSQAKILGQFPSNQEQKKKAGDTNRNRETLNQQLKIKEDEKLLSSDPQTMKIYFQANSCLYSKVKSLTAGEAFGGYSPYHFGTFVAEEDTSLFIIPQKKYEKFFQPEVVRFQHVNTGIADMFCRNEQNVINQTNEDEAKAQIDQKIISPLSNQISTLLETLCSDFQLKSQSNDQSDKDDDSKRDGYDFIGTFGNQLENNQVQQRQAILKNKFSFQDKKKMVEILLCSSEISYYFEMQKFEETTCIYSEGEPVEYYYLIELGKITLKKIGIDNILNSYSEGDFIGFEDDDPQRKFSCTAEKGTQVYKILKRAFESNLHPLLTTYFKQLIKFTKNSLLSSFKDQRESGLIRGSHKKNLNINSRSLSFNPQLKQQIALDLLKIITQGSSRNQNLPSSLRPSVRQLTAFPLSDRSLKKGVRFSENFDRNTRTISLTGNDHNKKSEANNSKQSQIGFSQYSSNNYSQINSNKSQAYEMEPMKLIQAQRIVMNQLKKEVQQKEEEKKKSQAPILERNVEVSFIKYDVINNTKIKSNSSFFKRLPDQESLISTNKKRSIQSPHPPLQNLQNRQYLKLNSPSNASSQIDNQPSTTTASSLSHTSSTSRLRKYSFSEYLKLNTFSNTYHKKKQIIQINHLNEILKENITSNSSQRKSSFDISESEKMKQKIQDPFEEETVKKNGSSSQNQEQSEWFSSVVERHKELDIYKIKNEIEKQILSIPKFFQDKLWGSHACKSIRANKNISSQSHH